MGNWKKGVELTLPSGNTAVVRPFGLEVIVAQGFVPDVLTPFVAELAEGKWSDALATFEGNQKFFELAQCVARYCFLSPRIVDTPRDGEDEIRITDIDQPDLMWLMNQVGAAAAELQSFRPKQAHPVAVMDIPARDGHTPVQATRLEAVG